MKWIYLCGKVLCGKTALCLLLTGWAGGALAVSKYTDKENALNLAEALDKGIYRNRLVTATFIQSVGKGQYFIKAVLDNGAEHNWNLRRIRALSKNDAIVLSRNRALVFLTDNSNEFAVLDKTRFSQLALIANVYVKRYKSSDVLAGKKIAFGIQRFNLVRLLGVRPGKDEKGYPHRYVLDLENGQREKLSYLDAYYTLHENGLLQDGAGVGAVMRRPYRIEKITPIHLKPLGASGTGKFGVELTFDRPIDLSAGFFPFRFFENGGGSLGTSGAKFVVEVTAPNAVLGRRVKTINSLEYLRNIHVVPDGRNPVRIILRAVVTPAVINFPPEVEVSGSTVRVSFTKVMDQTVYDRQTLARKALRVRQDRLLHRTLTPEEAEMRRRYEGFMDSGNENLHVARRSKSFQHRYDAYQKAQEDYQNAAANATHDLSLEDALRARNSVMRKIPQFVIQHVRREMRRGDYNADRLRSLLQNAAGLTQNMKLQITINSLIRRIK